MRRVRDPEQGSVTAELAVALPAVALLLVALLLVGAVSSARLRCADAARAGARAAALGEVDTEVARVARHIAGDDAAVSVRRDGEWATVVVALGVGGGALGMGPMRAEESATAWVEP